MAIRTVIGHSTLVTFAVVLGQQGSDPLVAAGNAALTLSRSIRSGVRAETTSSGTELVWVGPQRDIVTLATDRTN